MNSDNFSYIKPNGKRALRTWVLATLVILLVVVGVFGYSIYASSARQASIDATPRPVTVPSAAPQTPTAIPSATAIATVDPAIAAATAQANCPKDSTQWKFKPIAPDSNFAQIDPPCVYHFMDPVIAWIMASQTMGWDQQKAIGSFGFKDDPYDVITHTVDLLPPSTAQKVVTVNDTYRFPINPGYQRWYIDVNGQVIGAKVVVNGCYSLYTIVNGVKQYYSTQFATSTYTTLCNVSLDYRSGWAINEYKGKVYSRNFTSSGGYRIPLIFGYDNTSSAWYYIGALQNTSTVSDDVMNSSETAAQSIYNSPIWDLTWAEGKYGIQPNTSLPDNWQTYTNQQDKVNIDALLNQ